MRNRYNFLASVAFAPENEELGIIQLEDNLADVDKPQEVPPGVYTAEVQDVQIPTSSKGNQYFSVRFLIPQDELPANLRDDYEEGAMLFWNRVLVPNGRDRRALYNVKKLLEALGLDANTNTIDPNEWMGRKARIRVVTGKWQGEDRAEIRAVEAAEAGAPVRPSRKPMAEIEDEDEDVPPPSGKARRPARK